jgi:hypothetical protein
MLLLDVECKNELKRMALVVVAVAVVAAVVTMMTMMMTVLDDNDSKTIHKVNGI